MWGIFKEERETLGWDTAFYIGIVVLVTFFLALTYGRNKKDPAYIVYYDIAVGLLLLAYGYTYVVMTKEMITDMHRGFGDDLNYLYYLQGFSIGLFLCMIYLCIIHMRLKFFFWMVSFIVCNVKLIIESNETNPWYALTDSIIWFLMIYTLGY